MSGTDNPNKIMELVNFSHYYKVKKNLVHDHTHHKTPNNPTEVNFLVLIIQTVQFLLDFKGKRTAIKMHFIYCLGGVDTKYERRCFHKLSNPTPSSCWPRLSSGYDARNV